MSEKHKVGQHEFVRSGTKILIFVNDALSDASTNYPTEEEAKEVFANLKRYNKVETVRR
jgi:hypothetical protein